MIHDNIIMGASKPKIELNQLGIFKLEEPESQNEYPSAANPTKCFSSFSLVTENNAAVGTFSQEGIISSQEPLEEGKHFNMIDGTEQFAFLEGLNSGNLMKFSQQSQLDELFLRETLEKNKKDVLPVLEEHDNGGSNFEINLNSQRKGKVNWYYSEKTKKVYIKPKEIFNIEVACKSTMALENLHVRAMMVFVKNVSEPVLRCLNHSSKDIAVKENIKHSLLRCENANVIYVGSTVGKNITDRLSIIIPLGSGIKSNRKDLTKQTIALKFACQNSCVGRQETSVIFYLENMNGDILAQRYIDVKVCSCPKRDMAMEEKNVPGPAKRSHNGESATISRKRVKIENLKKGAQNSRVNNILKLEEGGYEITMKLPDKKTALFTIQSGLNMIGYERIINPNSSELYISNFRQMKQLLENVERLP